MADSGLFMECVEDDPEPWQQIIDEVEDEEVSPVEGKTSCAPPVGSPVELPAPVSTPVVAHNTPSSGDVQKNTVTLLTSGALAQPAPGQQLILTQGPASQVLQLVLTVPVYTPGAGSVVTQPLFIATQPQYQVVNDSSKAKEMASSGKTFIPNSVGTKSEGGADSVEESGSKTAPITAKDKPLKPLKTVAPVTTTGPGSVGSTTPGHPNAEVSRRSVEGGAELGGEKSAATKINWTTRKRRKNYCYVCRKPQSKLSRHWKMHAHEELDIARALSFPKGSKQRKALLEILKNRGNYAQRSTALRKGLLKVKRQPKKDDDSGKYAYCVYCKGLFINKELCKHVKRCTFKSGLEGELQGGNGILVLDAAAQFQNVSEGVSEILDKMNQDKITSVVRNDICILQLAQSFYNKHGQDQPNLDYIRQKLREIGRFLLALRNRASISNLEDAVKPENFDHVIEAVKEVAGFDKETNCYKVSNLALRIGYSLKKVSKIIHCRGLMAEDTELMKSTKMFQNLYSANWSQYISHTVTKSQSKYKKVSMLSFTQDFQLLHKYLEEMAHAAMEDLCRTTSSQMYGDLSKATLTQILLFNRRHGGVVSKILLKSFHERDQSELREDIARGLTKFEQNMCNNLSRIEVKGNGGQKVAILLTPNLVNALTLLVDKRKECGVGEKNKFLFGRPKCLDHYKGQEFLRIYASQCGAKNPDNLRSMRLHKHVATLSQILSLKDEELDQLVGFLGYEGRGHLDYRRFEASAQLAKMSKLLLAKEKGRLPNLQGRTLDEIAVEDKLDLTDLEDDGSQDETGSESEQQNNLNEGTRDSVTDPGTAGKERRTATAGKADGKQRRRKAVPQRRRSKSWENDEVMAVMRHFKDHISQGQLATLLECQRCKMAEHAVLDNRTIQNIRDFVRNRGIAFKKQSAES